MTLVARRAMVDEGLGRDPIGVHGVFRVFDGRHYRHLDKGSEQVLDRSLPTAATSLASTAH